MAKAGLATAAVAGLVERARSKSRGPDAPERTKLRAGAPIIAAGLGGAALAGLYENNKATKQKTKQKERPKKKESSRSRSRSRARSGGDQTGDTGPLVEYGGEPIPTQDYYNRPRSRADSYYSDDSGARGDRRRGSPGSSTSSSPPRARLKERSQSRGRDSVDAAAAGAAAHEADQRRERRRAQRERRSEFLMIWSKRMNVTYHEQGKKRKEVRLLMAIHTRGDPTPKRLRLNKLLVNIQRSPSNSTIRTPITSRLHLLMCTLLGLLRTSPGLRVRITLTSLLPRCPPIATIPT